MSGNQKDLAGRYRAGLRAYLKGAGEDSLESAHGLGRTAIREGIGVLDWAHVHHTALAELLESAPPENGSARVIGAAGDFFAEGLSAYEMAYRGYVEANFQLKALAENLEEKVAERTRRLEETYDELRIVQERVHRAEKMKSIGTLVSGIAHEFNNLLAAIKGSVFLSLRQAENDVSLRRHLDDIGRNVDRAAGLIRKMLMFSDRQTALRERLHLNQVVSDFFHMFPHFVGGAHALELDLDRDLWMVKVNANHVHQILMNLIANAKEAMPDGGRIAIQTSNVIGKGRSSGREEHRRSGKYVCLTIRDEGVGMSAEIKGRIFEPFFTTKRLGQGTGLGLSVVFGVLAQHNGWVQVDSAPGEGSAFRIFLPAAGEAVGEEGAAPAPEGSGMRPPKEISSA